MTASPKWTPLNLVPKLDEEVEKAREADGAYKILPPSIKEGVLAMPGVEPQHTCQLRCNSLCVKKPDTICKCNSVVTTYVGKIKGDQIQIIECGKCRTAYLVRTRANDKGEAEIISTIWDTSRNLKNFVKKLSTDNGDYIVMFNKESK